ncbi:FAD-dependent monooxygenase [Sulfurirhabdus autotrophica]|uniref:2-octaprenyl-6-methoxyphenol hydroxylase n=1 Tax=Sulfurirhabdus autotrophica TaxID=1706046 RepID=A0A4R3Y0D3_9PROT|nr:FAD-dependent monooxygenase [Sulfurirhabdus autotrophica]TCV84691.1 2-octaprenyl-6-methoxyphenol hydroxylase [Sulfurirhabdus autotrophica]
MIDHVDVLIVGGGPVGATLALALKASGLQVMVLEARHDFSRKPDPRTLALSYGSKLILERMGIWSALPQPTSIETIHISHEGGLGRSVLSAEQEGIPALGYVVNYAALDQALHEALLQSNVHYLTGAQVTQTRATQSYAVADFDFQGASHQVTARLLALADGGRNQSGVSGAERHVRDYRQTAVVAQVKTELPHKQVAYERFTPDGPVALLPSGDGFALVWTATPEAAEAILQLDDTAFMHRLHAHFGDRLGGFVQAGHRASFPLSLSYTKPVTGPRKVALGNAAQMLHPVAGQGFNLGLRDAWELATEILHVSPSNIGSAEMLAHYSSKRRMDTAGGILFTDALVRVFSNDNPLLHHSRGAALIGLDLLPPLKSLVARKMIFGARG